MLSTIDSWYRPAVLDSRLSYSRPRL